MARAIDIRIHPDFTIDELIQYTNWNVPSHAYRENLRGPTTSSRWCRRPSCARRTTPGRGTCGSTG